MEQWAKVHQVPPDILEEKRDFSRPAFDAVMSALEKYNQIDPFLATDDGEHSAGIEMMKSRLARLAAKWIGIADPKIFLIGQLRYKVALQRVHSPRPAEGRHPAEERQRLRCPLTFGAATSSHLTLAPVCCAQLGMTHARGGFDPLQSGFAPDVI